MMPAVADACAIASASPKPTVHIMPYRTTLNPTAPNSAAAAAKPSRPDWWVTAAGASKASR